MEYKHGGNIYKAVRESGMSLDDMLDFSANINPLSFSEVGLDLMKERFELASNYPDPEYIQLKGKIATFNGVHEKHVFLGNGAADSIFDVMRAIKPSSALIISPTFGEYERALRSVNCSVDYFILSKEEAFDIDFNKLIYRLSQGNYDFVVVCNPNNPTGRIYKKESIKSLIDFANENRISVLIDEAFMDFVVEEKLYSVQDLVVHYDNLFVTKSLTKFFAVPGMRLGYVITCSSKFCDYYKSSKPPWPVNSIAESYGIGALGDESYIENTRKYIEREITYMIEGLSGFSNVEVFGTVTNYVLIKYSGGKPLSELFRKSNILIRECGNFVGLDEMYFRFAIKSRENNSKFLAVLKEILKNDM
jgi:threonine-phosphate decarboxylase